MQNLFQILILFICGFSLIECQDKNNAKNKTDDPSIKLAEFEEKFGKTESSINDSPEELRRKREENDKKTKERLLKYLKDLGLENSTKITREQFKKIFLLFLESEQKKEEDESKEKKSDEDLSIIKGFSNQLFDSIVPKDIEFIEVDKIMDFFQPQNIISALREILKPFGLESIIDAISDRLTEYLEKISSAGSKNNTNITSTENFNKTNSNNNTNTEKNSDL